MNLYAWIKRSAARAGLVADCLLEPADSYAGTWITIGDSPNVDNEEATCVFVVFRREDDADLRVDPVPIRPLVLSFADAPPGAAVDSHSQLPIRMKGAQ